MYEVIFDEKPIEFLAGLPKKTRKRIFDKIMQSKVDPFHYFEPLKARKDYKLRVGVYRVIADINQNEKTIQITRAGHRKNIYKKLG